MSELSPQTSQANCKQAVQSLSESLTNFEPFVVTGPWDRVQTVKISGNTHRLLVAHPLIIRNSILPENAQDLSEGITRIERITPRGALAYHIAVQNRAEVIPDQIVDSYGNSAFAVCLLSATGLHLVLLREDQDFIPLSKLVRSLYYTTGITVKVCEDRPKFYLADKPIVKSLATQKLLDAYERAGTPTSLKNVTPATVVAGPLTTNVAGVRFSDLESAGQAVKNYLLARCSAYTSSDLVLLDKLNRYNSKHHFPLSFGVHDLVVQNSGGQVVISCPSDTSFDRELARSADQSLLSDAVFRYFVLNADSSSAVCKFNIDRLNDLIPAAQVEQLRAVLTGTLLSRRIKTKSGLPVVPISYEGCTFDCYVRLSDSACHFQILQRLRECCYLRSERLQFPVDLSIFRLPDNTINMNTADISSIILNIALLPYNRMFFTSQQEHYTAIKLLNAIPFKLTAQT